MCRGFDPLFSLWQDRARSFWGIFSHPPTPKRSFGVLKLPILTEFDLLGPKFHFSLDLFGSNFQRPAAHPHHFSDRVPPPGVQVISIHCAQTIVYTATGLILCMHPANERWRYTAPSSLIGWVHTQNDPCCNTPSQPLSISQIIHMDCELSHLLLLPPSVVKIPIITAGNPNPLCTDNITTHHPSHCPSLSSSTWTLSSPISHFCHHV